MDFTCDENSWPSSFKHLDQVPLLKDYIGKPQDKKKEYLEPIISNSLVTAKVLMYNALLNCKDLLHHNIQFFSDLITAV